MTFQETAIRAALPRAQFGDASELLTRCRQVKSANEIERIQEACKITEVAWELIRRRVYPCMTVPQAERICIHSLGDAGLDPVTPGFILLDVLGYGPDFNYSKGDLFFAISATLITATKPISPVSRPSDHQAQPRADHARLQRSPGCDEAGQRCQNVAAVFNREVESPGYPRLQESKRIGHGLGLEHQESPSLNVVDDASIDRAVRVIRHAIQTQIGAQNASADANV